LHLSEDIFAGFNCIMRGGAVVYQEFIHVGKGRDMGFIAINGFEQKISAGNALQSTSRELYRLGKHFDLPRLLSFYFTGTGFFITQRLTTSAIYVMCMAFLVLALLRSESLTISASQSEDGRLLLRPEWETPAGPLQGRRMTGAEGVTLDEGFLFNSTLGFGGQLAAELDAVRATWAGPGFNATEANEFVGSFAASTYQASFGLLQLGFFSVLPYFLELWLEFSFGHAAWENMRLIAMGSWVFFLFASQTKGFRLAEAIRHGKAGYVATGRGYVIEPGSFVGLYGIYAKSHMYTGFEAMSYLILYHVYATRATWMAVFTLWLYVFAMLFAPYMFNPQSLSINTIFMSFEELLAWYRGEADKNNKDHRGSWKVWHDARLATPRSECYSGKLLDHTRIFVLRLVLLLPVAARLETAPDSQPSYRLVQVLLPTGAIALGAQILVYLLVSERTLCAHCIACLNHCSSRLAWAYRLIVVASVVAGASLTVSAVVGPYCDLTWANAERSNGNVGLLFFAAMLFTTYCLQLLVTLEPPSERAVVCCSAGSRFKALLIDFADYYYFVMDVGLSLMLILLLSIFSTLPLLRLQSSVLFNRDFAKVIQTKLSRAELLKRILS